MAVSSTHCRRKNCLPGREISAALARYGTRFFGGLPDGDAPKLDLNAQHGVQEYWIVDPERKSITVLVRGENRFEVTGIYGEDQTLRSPSLSHFSIALQELF